MGNVKAQHKLATLTQEGTLSYYGNPVYAKEIFNELASDFEERLVNRLGYTTPWALESKINDALLKQYDTTIHPNVNNEKITTKGNFRILDLGCGTGLCAKAFTGYKYPH